MIENAKRWWAFVALVVLLSSGFLVVWNNSPSTSTKISQGQRVVKGPVDGASSVEAKDNVTAASSAKRDQSPAVNFFADKLSALLTTLLGSFFGAYFAFRLQRRRTDIEKREDHVGAANRALFALYRMWNILSQYQREHLNPVRQQGDRWLNLTATPLAPHGSMKFDAGNLSFLLQTKEANVFSVVLLEEERFGLAIGLIERRSALAFGEVFPRMERAGVRVGEQRPAQEIQSVLGIAVVHQLQQLTEHIFRFVDDDVQSLHSAFHQLRDAMERLYPDEKFITIDWGEHLHPTASGVRAQRL